MKKAYIIIAGLVFLGFLLKITVFKANDETANSVINNAPTVEEKSKENNSVTKKTIDIQNTIVECKNGSEYKGQYLIENNIIFSLVGSRLFFKGEELEKLCNPGLDNYDYDSEPSYSIKPVYTETQ